MRKKLRQSAWLLLLAAGSAFLLQSCAASRGCGCDNDLSKNYKPPKSHKRNIY
ncbi:MAG: hypothetical protein QM642_08580 [Edaphocola sp.]